MKSFDNEMIQIRNELLNLKSYMTKKTSVFRTEEYAKTLKITLDNNIFSDLASGSYLEYYKTENGSTPLATVAVEESFVNGIYRVRTQFYPSFTSDTYYLYVYISTTDQSIIDRLKNGETVVVDVPVYITTTSTFIGMQ